MKPTLHLVKLASIPILHQLQLEEALLRADKRNWCIINQGSPPAIVMGISGQPHQLIRQEKLEKSPIPVIRRFSGGGTVIVDEETLFVTLICQTDALSVHPFPRSIMEWTAKEIYQPIFVDMPFQLQENDYVLEGRKWGGNAQSIIKGRWLHHSSLLWNYTPENMEYLLMPPKTPEYRQGRTHADFLCRLRDFWIDSSHLQSHILQQLGFHFHVVEKQCEELSEIAALPHRKTTCIEDRLYR